jgi:GNAT superfamily N-acetyltransferase
MPTATLTVTPLDADDPAEVAAAYQVRARSGANDVPDFPAPCRVAFEVGLRVPWPGEETHRWVARSSGGEVVGYVSADLPTLDNLTMASVDIVVLPEHRRQGYGRILYAHVVEFLRGRGRRLMTAFTAETLPDGGPPRDPGPSAFARTMGMQSALGEVRRRLDLETLDRAALDAMLADARAASAGYSLVHWGSVVPEEYIEGVALLDSDFFNQAPLGDLQLEAENVDAARIRAMDEARAKVGRVAVNTAAVHDETGDLVAWSNLGRPASHVEHVGQGITLVHPAHRGHRLGLLTKIENLNRAIAELPGMRYVDTWNAAVNKHMIEINERMGFRAVDYWHNWQQEI